MIGTASNSFDSDLAVSVIIPTYNRAALVSAAVKSTLEQTSMPAEVLVIDDGSTDETPEVLLRFGPPVRVIRQRNRGRSAARNVGIREAAGDAIVFLDSDDLLGPNFIQACSQILQENSEVGMVYTDYYLTDALGQPVGRGSELAPDLRPSGWVLGDLARRNFLTMTALIRKVSIDDITLDEGLDCAEDYDLWRQLAVRCQFQYLDEPLYCYRYHDDMTTITMLEEMGASQLEVQKRLFEMAEFKQLQPRVQARGYCSHGVKQAMVGDLAAARKSFWQSIRVGPSYLLGIFLWLLSFLGLGTLQAVINGCRKVVGNKLALEASKMGDSTAPETVKEAVAQAIEVGETIWSEEEAAT